MSPIPFQSGVGNLVVAEFQLREIGQPRKAPQARTRDPREATRQALQVLEVLQVRKPLVAYASVADVERFQPCNLPMNRTPSSLMRVLLTSSHSSRGKLPTCRSPSSRMPVFSEAEPKKIRHPGDVAEFFIRDVGIIQTKVAELLHRADACQRGVADVAAKEDDSFNVRHAADVDHSRVADLGAGKIELRKPGQAHQVRTARVGNVREIDRRQVLQRRQILQRRVVDKNIKGFQIDQATKGAKCVGGYRAAQRQRPQTEVRPGVSDLDQARGWR